MQDCTHFVACLTDSYFEHLEQQSGRPFLEMKAAASVIPSQRIICVCPDQGLPPPPQRVQQLNPLELRKAFVSKPLVFYSNLGHMEVFETCMARFLGIEHDADLIQLPMGGLLESAGLGHFIRPLRQRFGCESVTELVHLTDDCLEVVGMDKVQMSRFHAGVEQDMLYLFLEAHGVGYVWRRLQARHSKEMASAAVVRKNHGSPVALSFAYVLNLSGPAILDLCKGDPARAHDVKAVIRKAFEMPAEQRYNTVDVDGTAVQEQSVKSLVEKLWTPDVPCTVRAHAAELIRRKSLTLTGLEEIRNIAGLESLIKLVDEGLPAEKVAALWTLRNFAVVELYRSRVATMAVVMTLCVTMLEDHHQPPSVHHAAAGVLQVATTADRENVKQLSTTNALLRLVSCLYGKHRGLKVAALATISNLVVLDSNKRAIAYMKAVPRLVTLLSSSSASVSAMAVGAVHQLVQHDANRLKTWRCGGPDKLKAIVDAGQPHVSDIASEAIQVLMAGPRISPQQTFKTATGRHLPANEMKAAIQRLNAQHSYLDQQSTGVGFQATSPNNMEALTVRPPSAPAVVTGGSKLRLTRVRRQDFDARPHTARACVTQAVVLVQGKGRSDTHGCKSEPVARVGINLGPNKAVGTRRPDKAVTPARAAHAGPLNRHNCTSEFARKLTQQQQTAMADRLATSHKTKFADRLPTHASRHSSSQQRNMKRNLSLWDRPGEIPARPTNTATASKRQSGRYYRATASRKYRTVDGKTISAERIDSASRQMAGVAK
eukprot:jgi/Ulvmu1/5939/UM026_0061.1